MFDSKTSFQLTFKMQYIPCHLIGLASLLECPSTSMNRQVLIDMINNNCNNFQYLNLSDTFFWLLNCESIDILQQLGYFFIKTSFLIYM
jgi:hypothetical protein